MAQPRRASSPTGVLHRLVSRADAREALAWFVLVALAFPPWRTLEIEGSAGSWEVELWPYATLAGIAVIAVASLTGALGPPRTTMSSGRPSASINRNGTSISRSAWFVILSAIVYAAAVGELGFPLASSLFVAGTVFALGIRHWLIIIGVSIGLPIIAVVIVVGLCGLSLPPGTGPFANLTGVVTGLVR